MFYFIEKLRDKPEAYRVRVVFIGATVVTGTIFLIWLFATIFLFKNDPIDIPRSKNPSFFSEMSTQFSIILDTGKAKINDIRNSIISPENTP